MEVCNTALKDLWLVKPDIHTDFRGDYVMLYHEGLYNQFDIKFVEHDISTSFKGVLRGIHYSPNCWKLYQILYGAVYYVFVNCDKDDREFGTWTSIILDDKKHWQVIKHPRYGAGFLVLSDYCVLHYMQSEYYDAGDPDQQTFKYDDLRFNIWWPNLSPPILSKRDEQGEYNFRLGDGK